MLERYPNADEIFWLQEEPENMGPWNSIKGRLYEAHGDDPLDPPGQPRRVRQPRHRRRYAIHQAERRDLFDSALSGLD